MEQEMHPGEVPHPQKRAPYPAFLKEQPREWRVSIQARKKEKLVMNEHEKSASLFHYKRAEEYRPWLVA